MTIKEFFGCAFLAFGPAVSLFIFVVGKEPIRVILFIASSFFWLISLLISSLLWFAVVPLREKLAFGLVFSVLFQEASRLAYYKLVQKAENGLQKMMQNDQNQADGDSKQIKFIKNHHLMALVCGLAFGMTSGAFALVNILSASVGPGTVGIHGDSDHFFITSSLLTLAFVMLNTFWQVISYAAMDKKSYWQVAVVVLFHLLVSCLTLLNNRDPPVYAATITPAYVLVVISGIWAFIVAGGSLSGIKAFCGF